jgi:hypothetical protein
MDYCLEQWDLVYPPASLKQIPGDGNCQFRALSWALYNDESRHAEIRSTVCEYMDQNIDLYKDYIVDPEAFVGKMRNPGVFGDRVTLQAFCDAFHTNVMLLQDSDVVAVIKPRRPIKSRHLVITYERGCHYNAVTPSHAQPTGAFLRQITPRLDIENRIRLPITHAPHE